MGKLRSLIRRLPKRTSALVAMVAAAVVVPAVLFAWGPDRPTYTTEHPADHVTFNSITNNPAQGDERNFMQVREANASNETYADSISLQAGHEYVVYIYYHNDAASNLNDAAHNYAGIAKDAYVKAEIPAVVPHGSTGTKAVGYVGASNASPKQVWDDIAFKNSSAGDMALRYVPGSATIHSFGKVNGQTMADSVVTSGAPLGYDKLDGTVPGCNQYAGYVTFRIKADQPGFTMKKQVRLHGTSEWKDSVTANPGDTVDYLISYDNTGTTWQNDVVVDDNLPTGVNYITGSTKVYNVTNPNGIKVSDNVTKGGINIGNYNANSNAFVMFSGKVATKDALKCGKNTLTNKATVETNNGNKSDTADVTVNKECTPPPCNYACKSLSVTKVDRTHFTFKSTYEAQNATYKSTTYVVRDQSGKEVYRGSSSSFSTETPGNYTVQAYVTFTVNGQDKTVTSDSCKKPFTVEKKPVTPVYTCDSLHYGIIERNEFGFTAKASASGGATVKDYTFDFGDGQTYTGNATVDHTYAQDGTYTVRVTANIDVNGHAKTATSDNCVVKVTVTPVPPEKVKVCNPETGEIITVDKKDADKYKPVGDKACQPPKQVKVCNPETGKVITVDEDQAHNYKPVDDEACQPKPPVENCEIPGKENLPKDSPDCVETPVTPETPQTPPELPHTGIGDGIMALLGAGSLIAVISYYIASRRSLN